MDYEQKYKEALALARSYYDKDSMNAFLDTIFPEIVETTSKDERTRRGLVKFISDIKSISESGRTSWAIRSDDAKMCETFLTYLEKRKEQKPAEWNKEDEQKIRFLSRLIEFQVKDDEYCFGDGSLISKQEAIEMLKSLCPSWKPSEEQMGALQNAERLVRPYYPEHAKILAELYEQLEKS